MTIQALGWRSGGRQLPLAEGVGSAAFRCQMQPHALFPQFPSRNGLEVI